MVDLLDANVWLALSASDHAHHQRALSYWVNEAADRLALCRITSLALLRLLTNASVLGAAALSGKQAWGALEIWLATPGVEFLGEPPVLEELLRDWAGQLELGGGGWTDAYLAAFAAAANGRLVSFDHGFRRFPGISVLHLQI